MSDRKRNWVDSARNINLLVTHKGCADGAASAMIINQATGCDVQLCHYGDKLHREIPARPGVLLCDMSPPPGREQEMAEAGVMVLDHHESQKAQVEAMGELSIYSETMCGAELAFEHVWLPISHSAKYPEAVSMVRSFARLCGVYDRWQRGSVHWTRACWLREGLLQREPWELLGNTVTSVSFMNEIEASGRAAYEVRMRKAKELAENAYVEDGVVLINHPGMVNDVALLLEDSGHRILAAFSYKMIDDPYPHLGLSVSLRAIDKTVDVSKIAARCGGGGHPGAAGFMLRGCPGYPVEEIMNVIRGENDE